MTEFHAMRYQYATVKGTRIFYRECGSLDKPTMVLFHGFPSSSHMFRDLMPMLAHDFFVYPGAEAFRKDVPKAVIHPVDSGHFALESCCGEIADWIRKVFVP